MIYIFHMLVFFYTSHLATTGPLVATLKLNNVVVSALASSKLDGVGTTGTTNYQVIIISYGSHTISDKPST